MANPFERIIDFGNLIDDEVEQIYGLERQQALEDRQYNAMREDTAYQRAVADLKAAGLNPWLATGNPASSQAISNISGTTSKMREIGVQYRELFEKTIIDTMNASANSADKMSKILERIAKAGMGIAGLF